MAWTIGTLPPERRLSPEQRLACQVLRQAIVDAVSGTARLHPSADAFLTDRSALTFWLDIAGFELRTFETACRPVLRLSARRAAPSSPDHQAAGEIDRAGGLDALLRDVRQIAERFAYRGDRQPRE